MQVFLTWHVISISERGKIVNVHDEQLITENALDLATRATLSLSPERISVFLSIDRFPVAVFDITSFLSDRFRNLY